MYAEPGLMYPMLQWFPHNELPYFDPRMSELVQTCSILEYDLGDEGDLFKAPEPIIEEPAVAFDPLSAAMTIISNGQNVMTETIDVANMESIQNDHLQDVLYDCGEELLAKYAFGESFSPLEDAKEELLASYAINESFPGLEDVKEDKYSFPKLEDFHIPVPQVDEVPGLENARLGLEEQLQKSVSSGCLEAMEWIGSCSTRPNFLDFQGVDFETAFGLRRAYSEGDIQALGNNTANFGNTSNIHASFERQLTISELKTEERKQKLSRYRNKKSKRNFGRKIKYECRKALADNQPRIRGRFAKTDDCLISKPSKVN